MELKTQFSSAWAVERARLYSEMPLLELTERIASNADHQASKELHDNRVLFCSGHKKALRLVEYIAAIAHRPLARRWGGYDDLVLDRAYDQTVDKFANIPAPTADAARVSSASQQPSSAAALCRG